MEFLPYAPVTVDFSEDLWNLSLEDPEEQLIRETLASRIADELRDGKVRYAAAQAVRPASSGSPRPPAEVLIPAGLLDSIAGDVLEASRDEPCGIRGCVIYIDYEEPSSAKGKTRIGTVNCDPYTVNTFELYLTLRPLSSFGSTLAARLPLFLQHLAHRSCVISSDYHLLKRKLFRSTSH